MFCVHHTKITFHMTCICKVHLSIGMQILNTRQLSYLVNVWCHFSFSNYKTHVFRLYDSWWYSDSNVQYTRAYVHVWRKKQNGWWVISALIYTLHVRICKQYRFDAKYEIQSNPIRIPEIYAATWTAITLNRSRYIQYVQPILNFTQ
jgi:hypothetical protein